MMSLILKIASILSFVSLMNPIIWAQNQDSEKHDLVAMRLIGHQILLNSGDTNSKILPIQQSDNSFRIEFDSGFAFNPSELSITIDSILLAENVSTEYVVEVEAAETGEIVYSYEFTSDPIQTEIPCGTRSYEKNGYSIIITCQDELVATADSKVNESANNSTLFISITVIVIILIILFSVARKRRKVLNQEYDALKIGKYVFNKKKLTLSFENELIELTSKEADLLSILYDSANDTLERETILNVVWEDQGVYVGRTLDVFISKLRKKLEADTSIKILNIRGVGYKLVLDK